MNHIVISCIGTDQTGIVDTLSNVIKEHQGNWQVSSLHHLSGFFAGVIEVAVSIDKTQALVTALNNIESLNCQIEIAHSVSEKVNANLTLELTANDRAGIVQEISSVIHLQGGNLIKLVSSQVSAAHTGQLMFNAKAHVAIQAENVDTLVDALENIDDDLMVDIARS
jgi:glycine cleavage system regulatory protein